MGSYGQPGKAQGFPVNEPEPTISQVPHTFAWLASLFSLLDFQSAPQEAGSTIVRRWGVDFCTNGNALFLKAIGED
jgi:hypothetical protein